MADEFYIDEDVCIACGTCSEICPDCFNYEEDMPHAEVIAFDCPEDQVQEAMDNCPVECIHWSES